MLAFNGNAGDRSFRAPLAADLSHAGLSVLLFDYRGYGRNPGSPSEAGPLKDARAACAYLAGRGDVKLARLPYFGESLGAAVAVAGATEQPPAALILWSPFTSLAEMGRVHYPFLPAIGSLLRDRFDSIDRIPRVQCPVLVIAGERDRVVPPAQSQRVYEAASAPKQFELIPGADHNDLELLTGKRVDRWSLVPVVELEIHLHDLAEVVAEQLLNRWGCLFRDLAIRDSRPPPLSRLGGQMASGNGSALRPSARQDSDCRVLASRQAFQALMAIATSDSRPDILVTLAP